MNLFSKTFGLLLITSVLCITLIESRDKNCHERIKYIQGGACKPGDGSKKHPFRTLAEADADQANWDVLTVLSSSIALDGGITLLDGRKLIGEEDPTCIALSPTQPTITNTTGTNGGHGVVVTGDATIVNIYFKNTQGNSIRYDDAVNLTVRNILITGAGRSGIFGNTTKSGKTTIANVIVRKNIAPSNLNIEGVAEILSNGIHREISVCNFEASDLVADQTTGVNQAIGIFVSARGTGTTSFVEIKDTYIHDFVPAPTVGNAGVYVEALESAHMTSCIRDSSFNNLGANASHIIAISENSTQDLPPADIKLVVNNCTFEELLGSSTKALFLQNRNGLAELCLKNSHIVNVTFPVASIVINSATQKIKIIGNTSFGGGVFYFPNSVGPKLSQMVTDVVIEDNTYQGVIAIQVTAGVPWDILNVAARNNCLSGIGRPGSFGFGGFTNGSGAGNAVIKAHHNSISGFSFDIVDIRANINYLVSKNWWGPATVACPPACGLYQTCQHNLCLGPDNVVIAGRSIVDASNPLEMSIKCPHTCCPLSNTVPTPQGSTSLDKEQSQVAQEATPTPWVITVKELRHTAV